jgi:hypothetical protein
VAAGAAVALLGSAVATAGPAGADTSPCPGASSSTATSCTYASTGAEQTFTVPAGVTAVTVAAVGAPGGTGANSTVGVGGFGASVMATVKLPAGTTTLYVEVGAPGETSHIDGGFNGGGGSSAFGGSGGGASDVRTVSCGSLCNTADPGSLASRLVVAGGGGGGSGFGRCGVPGGTAGDSTVSGPGNGGAGSITCQDGGPGGNGGYDNGTFGTGGAASPNVYCPAGSGSLGQGGSAPVTCGLGNALAGGGGGGYYGGGAGGTAISMGSGGGGGAGSSFWVPDVIGTPSMTMDTTGKALVTISWTAPAAVTGVSPASGPLADGTTVTITGSGFTGATAMDFGATPATSFTVNSDTSITATAPAAASAGPVDVTVTTPAGTSATSGADQYSYLYAFTGLLAPVANPPALNQVHAGQAIPIQFSLGGDFGGGILAAGSPTATQVNCSTSAPVNTATMTDTAGGSGLQYDATAGTYTYVWKTSKAWSGTCQQFNLTLNDGTSHTAIFQFG